MFLIQKMFEIDLMWRGWGQHFSRFSDIQKKREGGGGQEMSYSSGIFDEGLN